MGGEITSTRDLVNVAFEIPCLPAHFCAHRIGIGHFTLGLDAQPMIELADVIPKQEGSAVVEDHQHIRSAIVIEVADRQAARRKLPGEDGPAPVADVLKSRLVTGSEIVPEQGVLFVFDFAVQLGHLVIGDGRRR